MARRPPAPTARSVFRLLFASYLIAYVHRFSPASAAGAVRADFGLDAAGFALVGAVTYYAYAFMQPVAGLLADRAGARHTLAVFLLLAGAGGALSGLSPWFAGTLAGRAMVGAGTGVVAVCAWKTLAAWFPPERYVRAVGLFLWAGGFGSLLAFAPMARLNLWLGWRGAACALGALTALLGVAAWLGVRDAPPRASPNGSTRAPDRSALPPTDSAAPFSSAVAVGTGRAVPALRALRLAGGHAAFWKLGLWYALIPSLLNAYNGFWAGPYLREAHRLPEDMINRILSITAPGILLQLPLCAWLMERLPRRAVLAGATLAVTTACCLLVFGAGRLPVPLLYATAFLMTSGDCAAIGAIGLLRDVTPPELRGTAGGLFNGLLFAASAAMQTLIGALLAWRLPLDPPATAYAVAFAPLLAASLLGLGACLLKTGPSPSASDRRSGTASPALRDGRA